MTYIILTLLWILYYFLHSLLAANRIKNRFYSMGINEQRYRFLYSLIAILGLLAILFATITMPSSYIFAPSRMTKLGGLLLATWGFIIMRAAFRSYNFKAFLGLSKLDAEKQFVTTGLLRKVRHPLYAGSMVFIIGYISFNPKWSSLLSGILMITYFFIGIQFEEYKLLKMFGEKYRQYQENTPMLIPRWGKKNPRHLGAGE